MGNLTDKVVKRGKWYLKWRTTIWASVWFCVGIFGGNADRIAEHVPTLRYGTNLEQEHDYEALKAKWLEAKEKLDKLESEGV